MANKKQEAASKSTVPGSDAPQAAPSAATCDCDTPDRKAERERKLKEFREHSQKRFRSFFSDFKTFISKGNIMNLAVAVVIGAAFTAIVNALVGDIIMPFISLIPGQSGLAGMEWVLRKGQPDEAGVLVGRVVVKYGVFLQSIITFLLVAFVVFMILRMLMNADKGIKKLTKAQKKRLKNLKKHPEKLDADPESIAEEILEVVEAVEAEKPETAEDILRDIRELLKKSD
ncbi:MAG: large conductance mechanosensitive channel protein MscL [Firmicutes bacterium]|nr:large conductance mechanosensitive channel protein MscL [Bacillota bacterium]